MTNTASLHKARLALLATAAIAGLALAPSAANATAYALTAVDVQNLQFTGIDAFIPNSFSFTANSASSGTGLVNSVPNPDAANGTAASLTADLQDNRTSSGAVALGNLGFAPLPAALLPKQGPGGNYSTSQSAITSTSTNAAGPDGVLAFGSWRGTAEASVNGQLGHTNANAVSQQQLAWGLSLTNNPSTLVLDFDVSLLAAANITGSNLTGVARSDYELDLAFTGTGVNEATDVLHILNTSSPNPQGNADLNVGAGCTKSAISPIAGDTHIHCSFSISNIGTANQLSLLDTESVTVNQQGVPEPMTLSIMGAGLLGLGAAARRRRAKKAA